MEEANHMYYKREINYDGYENCNINSAQKW